MNQLLHFCPESSLYDFCMRKKIAIVALSQLLPTMYALAWLINAQELRHRLHIAILGTL